jgi:hypothetical protein
MPPSISRSEIYPYTFLTLTIDSSELLVTDSSSLAGKSSRYPWIGCWCAPENSWTVWWRIKSLALLGTQIQVIKNRSLILTTLKNEKPWLRLQVIYKFQFNNILPPNHTYLKCMVLFIFLTYNFAYILSFLLS